MSEDWEAVSRAINNRMAELDLSQRELIERSRVSKGVVSQLMRNVQPQPRRSPRTLEALSIALNWHPDHLAAVLSRHEPPQAGERNDLSARLAGIERQLQEISTRLAELRTASDHQFADINRRLAEIVNGSAPDTRSADLR